MRLRTLARFTASDPWSRNGSRNTLTDFRVEEYVMMPLGSTRALDSKWNLHTIGIQWESDARYRLLPESLVELWRHGRIPAEKLPELLHTLEPSLQDTDCLAMESWQRSIGIPLLIILFLFPAVSLFLRVQGEQIPAALAIPSGIFMALLAGLILSVMRAVKRRRVKEQMDWAIKMLSAETYDTVKHDR